MQLHVKLLIIYCMYMGLINLDTMTIMKYVFLYVLLVKLTMSQFHPEFCTPLPANLTLGPQLPTLKNQYYTTVEWRQMGTTRSVYIQEYFDEPGQRTSVIATGFYDPGDTIITLTNYTSNERLVIQDNTCKSNPLSDEGYFGFPFNKGNKTAYLLNANDALEFGRSLNETYIGEDTIRDIPVYHWRSCGYHDYLQTTVEVDFYFSIPDKWESASGVASMPIRSVIKRRESTTVQQPYFTYVYTETEEYDYVYFQEGLPSDLSVFQIPDGIYCANIPSTKIMPEVADYFSFGAEVTFTNNKVTGILNEWYDFKAQVARIDSENIPSPFIVTVATQDPTEQIHDFYSGLSYDIDKTTGICHVVPISIKQENFDVRYIDPNHVTVKTPQQFFDFGKKSFQYIGQRTVRDIPCDVWTALRTNFPPNSNETTFWEWYFSHGDWKISQSSGNHYQVPLKIVVTFMKNNAKIIYNIFDFQTKKPELSPFNVHPCYNETNIRYVRLNFTGPLILVSSHPDLVKESVHLALQKVMRVSMLRVMGIQTVFDNSELYVGFILFGPPEVDGEWIGRVNITSLDEAFNNLRNSTDQGDFTFSVNITESNNIKTGYFKAKPHSVRVAMKNDNGDIVDIIGENSTQQIMTTESPGQKSSHRLSTVTQSKTHSSRPHSTRGPPLLTPTTGVSSATPLSVLQKQPVTNTGWSGGAVAGLAIGMVILGILCGLAGAVIYIRKKNSPGFEMFQLK